MKKLSVGFLALALTLGFASCSAIETDLEIPQESLLKSYQLKRDASGAYSIDFDVADKTISDSHKDLNSLTNEFHLSKVGYDTKDQYREDLTLNNDKLRIGFFDDETGKSVKMSIEDENITFAKGDSKKFLKTYVLTSNNDGTIQLDFKVNDDVVTEFVYNEDLTTYEVHLSKGISSESEFSRTLKVPDTDVLKLDFVNHELLFGKGQDVVMITKKPRVVVQ